MHRRRGQQYAQEAGLQKLAMAGLSYGKTVMAGLVPAIHVFAASMTWMPGIRRA
jgi:hypothetical protein